MSVVEISMTVTVTIASAFAAVSGYVVRRQDDRINKLESAYHELVTSVAVLRQQGIHIVEKLDMIYNKCLERTDEPCQEKRK